MSKTPEREFRELLERNRPRLIRICKIYGREEEEKDLFQEIAYQIWRSMDNFRGEASIDTFLYRIALNTALVFKSKQKKKKANVSIEDAPLPAYQPDIAEESDRKSKLNWLYGAIKQLKSVDQSLILLYLEGMSYEEISEVTGLKVNHVGVKLNRIKKKLSNSLKIKK